MRLIRWLRGIHERRILAHPSVQAAFASEENRRNLDIFQSALNRPWHDSPEG